MQFDGKNTLKNPPPARLHFAAYESDEYLHFLEYEFDSQGPSDTLDSEDALAEIADFYVQTGELRMYLGRAAWRHFVKPANWEAARDPDIVRDFMETIVLDREGMNEAGFGEVVSEHPPLLNVTLQRMADRFAAMMDCRLEEGDMQAYLSAKQSISGHLSGAVRRRGTALARDREPWKAAGVSRATWYRRQKGQHTGPRGRPRKK